MRVKSFPKKINRLEIALITTFHYTTLEQFGKIWSEYLGHMKSNPKSAAPYLTSNESLLLFQGHLRVLLYLSYWYLKIRAIWINRAQIPQNRMK